LIDVLLIKWIFSRTRSCKAN